MIKTINKKRYNKGWKNLKPIKKGEVRNPKGRPPKLKCIPDILIRIGEEEIDTQNGKITKLEAIMRVVYKKAVQGVPWAVEFIANRTEGKSVETIRINDIDIDLPEELQDIDSDKRK